MLNVIFDIILIKLEGKWNLYQNYMQLMIYM